MTFHLLITIGDDVSALHGVRFVSYFFHNKQHVELTLLYIASALDATRGSDHLHPFPVETKLSSAQAKKARAALDAARLLLVSHGFAPESIRTRMASKQFGTVKDIAREARKGHYDAVVLGRRGYALFEKAFSTSVSREMLEHGIDFPIWVCRLPEEGRKNVLLCVEDTEPFLRMADHVGFILAQEREHSVTLLHIDSGDGQDVRAIMDRARQQLLINHVSDERIKELVLPQRRVLAAILEEVDRGLYAAIAVGRGGREKKGLIDKWLVGSISMKLLELLEKASLWVSK